MKEIVRALVVCEGGRVLNTDERQQIVDAVHDAIARCPALCNIRYPRGFTIDVKVRHEG